MNFLFLVFASFAPHPGPLPKGEGDKKRLNHKTSFLANFVLTRPSPRGRVGRYAMPLRRRIKVIEHQVDYHSGDRDVQPERQREAGDRFVAEEVPALGAAH